MHRHFWLLSPCNGAWRNDERGHHKAGKRARKNIGHGGHLLALKLLARDALGNPARIERAGLRATHIVEVLGFQTLHDVGNR